LELSVRMDGADSTNATENERLPTSLGWSKTNSSITLKDIMTAIEHIQNATNLITGDVEETGSKARRVVRDLHFGGGDL
jgi:hypothetical protein